MSFALINVKSTVVRRGVLVVLIVPIMLAAILVYGFIGFTRLLGEVAEQAIEVWRGDK